MSPLAKLVAMAETGKLSVSTWALLTLAEANERDEREAAADKARLAVINLRRDLDRPTWAHPHTSRRDAAKAYGREMQRRTA